MLSSFFVLFLSNSFAQDPAPPKEPAATEATVKKWTDGEKSTFITTCASGRPEHISETEMNRICSCTQSKLADKFSPAQLESPEAQRASEQIIGVCALGSKGNWSPTLKNQFAKGCTESVKNGISPTQLKAICSCSLNLLEARFDPSELGTPAVQDFSANAAKTCQSQVMGQ